MEETKVDSVQTQESSALDESSQINDPSVDYKKDMFKFKERMKAEAERARELEAKLKEYELTEEQKQGNFSKVIDELKEKSRTLEAQLKQKDYNYARSNIESAIMNEALKHNCKDPQTFVKLIDKNKYNVVSLDDGFNPSVDDIKMLVEDGMKQYEHIGLFGKKVKVVDGVPTKTQRVESKVNIDKMSWEEALAYAKTLDK
jgi:hypothetical protein